MAVQSRVETPDEKIKKKRVSCCTNESACDQRQQIHRCQLSFFVSIFFDCLFVGYKELSIEQRLLSIGKLATMQQQQPGTYVPVEPDSAGYLNNSFAGKKEQLLQVCDYVAQKGFLPANLVNHEVNWFYGCVFAFVLL